MVLNQKLHVEDVTSEIKLVTSQIDFWWLPNTDPLSPHTPVHSNSSPHDGLLTGPTPKLVSDLITESRQWNRSLICSTFEPHIASKIQNIILPLQGEDVIRWTLTKSGNFTVKSLYNYLIRSTSEDQGVPAHANGSPNLLKHIWHMQSIPKIKPFAWKCLVDILPTNERLSRIIDIDPKSALCHNGIETSSHLFMHCSFAKAVWYALPEGFILQQPAGIKIDQWFESIIHNPVQAHSSDLLDNFSYAALISWHIWKSRCKKIFEDIEPNPKSTVVEILALKEVMEKCFKEKSEQENGSRIKFSSSTQIWKPPPLSFLKINCDASFLQNNQPAGIGFIMRDSSGGFAGAECRQIQASSSEQAECIALLEAIKWAITQSVQNVILESDNKSICSYINGDKLLSDGKIKVF
ncbi:Reverse transcriptase zinc-binding domain [Macleaya cordata]|uniref:Reverse transcriptase zinc-binding domain n=1 Tax=Macleaya cordata TaxID=56857 RepID=A0A200QC03_MACCD|nr:Reverse transcriptase zinc-binding domain [Macleaya cordata]